MASFNPRFHVKFKRKSSSYVIGSDRVHFRLLHDDAVLQETNVLFTSYIRENGRATASDFRERTKETGIQVL